MKCKTYLAAVIASFAIATAAEAQVVGGIMTVTGAEMH